MWYSISFSFQTSLLDTESDQQAWYYSSSSIQSYPPQCGGRFSVPGSVASRVAPSPSGGSGSFLPLGPSRGGPAGIFSFYSMPALFHFGNSTTSGGHGVECLQPSLEFPGTYLFPSPALVPLVLSKFLAEHVNGQLRHLLLVAPCWMEAPWLPTVLNMLADVPQQCPIVKDLVMDVSVGQVLKSLQYLHLTLWLLSNVCYADRGSLPQSVRQWWGQLKHLHQGSTSSAGRSGLVGVLNRFTKQCHLCP